MTINKGQQAEQLAKEYLERQGLTFVEQNVRFPFGEIDLVMQDGTQKVFVEVKYRSSQAYGGAINAITSAQMKRIRKAAEHYMQIHRITQATRVDVVAISGSDITWLTDAF